MSELSFAKVHVPLVTAATPPSVNPTKSHTPTNETLGAVPSLLQAVSASANTQGRAKYRRTRRPARALIESCSPRRGEGHRARDARSDSPRVAPQSPQR